MCHCRRRHRAMCMWVLMLPLMLASAKQKKNKLNECLPILLCIFKYLHNFSKVDSIFLAHLRFFSLLFSKIHSIFFFLFYSLPSFISSIAQPVLSNFYVFVPINNFCLAWGFIISVCFCLYVWVLFCVTLIVLSMSIERTKTSNEWIRSRIEGKKPKMFPWNWMQKEIHIFGICSFFSSLLFAFDMKTSERTMLNWRESFILWGSEDGDLQKQSTFRFHFTCSIYGCKRNWQILQK